MSVCGNKGTSGEEARETRPGKPELSVEAKKAERKIPPPYLRSAMSGFV
jgi:hypothetical protein